MAKINKSINALEWNFKVKVKAFMSDSRVKKTIFLTETLRSADRQKELRAKWLSKVKRSKHQDWLAFDVAFYGYALYPSNMAQWREIADIAKEYKIDWGYDLWNRDKPHFQDNGKTYIKKKMRYNARSCYTEKADLSKKKIQYQQSKNRCWFYSNVTALSHSRGVEFSDDELIKLENYAKSVYNRVADIGNNPFVWAEILLSYMKEYHPKEKITAWTDNILKSKRLARAFINGYSVVIMIPWHATCAYFDYKHQKVVNVDSYEDTKKHNIKNIDDFLDKITNGGIQKHVIVYKKR